MTPSDKRLPFPSETQSETKGIIATEWRGPLPPPSILKDFDAVVQDGAERIMKAWEGEIEHRQHLERREFWLFAIDAIFGKLAALVFVLSVLLLAGFAIARQSEWAAMILGSGVIGSVAWAFVSTTRPHRKQRRTSPQSE